MVGVIVAEIWGLSTRGGELEYRREGVRVPEGSFTWERDRVPGERGLSPGRQGLGYWERGVRLLGERGLSPGRQGLGYWERGVRVQEDRG